MNEECKIKKKIAKEIENVYHLIDTDLMGWLIHHKIEPKKIDVLTNLDDMMFKEVWLVTDNVIGNESTYRIIFDSEIDAFGLECTLDSGLNWYMGAYGSLLETIENM